MIFENKKVKHLERKPEAPHILFEIHFILNSFRKIRSGAICMVYSIWMLCLQVNWYLSFVGAQFSMVLNVNAFNCYKFANFCL